MPTTAPTRIAPTPSHSTTTGSQAVGKDIHKLMHDLFAALNQSQGGTTSSSTDRAAPKGGPFQIGFPRLSQVIGALQPVFGHLLVERPARPREHCPEHRRVVVAVEGPSKREQFP